MCLVVEEKKPTENWSSEKKGTYGVEVLLYVCIIAFLLNTIHCIVCSKLTSLCLMSSVKSKLTKFCYIHCYIPNRMGTIIGWIWRVCKGKLQTPQWQVWKSTKVNLHCSYLFTLYSWITWNWKWYIINIGVIIFFF